MKRLFLIALTLLAGPAAMALEEPDYEVLLRQGDVEFRRYEPYIIAEVTVNGDREAFKVLAGYIFGDNEGQEKMEMTAPVESRENTAASAVTYAFVMEGKYTLATLPQPNDQRIRLLERPARTVAVRKFSGRWSDANIAKNEQRLLDDLAASGVETLGSVELARYNSPFTPWFLRRNEVMVPVVWPEQTP